MKDLSHYRKSYEKSELLESNISANPMELFKVWFDEAESAQEPEVNAMTLSTIGIDGFPKARVVLLKQFTEGGFVFFTNYNSEKGRAIANTPNVCLSFFWHSLERQVIIKGLAQKVSEEISDSYFESRPAGSKLSAAVSSQSDVVPSRRFLENALDALKLTSAENQIQRPQHWGGYIVKPEVIEFWQGRADRLHDRIRFTINSDGWKIDRLAP